MRRFSTLAVLLLLSPTSEAGIAPPPLGGVVGNAESEESIKARRDARIKDNKELRASIKPLVEHLEKSAIRSPERTLAMRSLQTAKHWLGEDLHQCGTEHPYPNSHNPENNIVDPPAP